MIFQELFEPPPVADDKELFKRLYIACENRLLACRPAYRIQQDMKGYLNAGSVLDRTKYRVENGVWTPEKGATVLHALLGRILEKTKTCLVG